MKTKVYLGKIRINRQGYDDTGRYWGIGNPLYQYQFDVCNDTVTGEFRAVDRETAKEILRNKYAHEFSFYR